MKNAPHSLPNLSSYSPNKYDISVIFDASFQKIFDDIIEKSKTMRISEAIENVLNIAFKANFCIVWVYLQDNQSFFSPSNNAYRPKDAGVLSYCVKNLNPLILSSQKEHSLYNHDIDAKLIPEDSSLILFPICSRDNSVLSIVQIARSPIYKPFENSNFVLVKFLAKKLSIYSRYIFPSSYSVEAALDLSILSSFPTIMKHVSMTLESRFRCRKADVWLNTLKRKSLFLFDRNHDSLVSVESDRAGVVSYCLMKCLKVHEKRVRDHPYYNQSIDGLHDEPVLAMPFIDNNNRCWAVILRGRANPSYFSQTDAETLQNIMPFVVQSITASLSPPQLEAQLDDFEKRLTTLLEVAEILTGVLDIDVLIPTIMEKAVELLKSERCSLFLVDTVTQELVTRFHGGLSQEIRIPKNRGIVGHTATLGEIINIPDAYSDTRFDRSIDIQTGYRTKSILCVPIYNNRGEIAGVTEMINKLDNEVFNEDDIKMLMAFNVFCGISLDNANLYNASLDLSRQLKTFVALSTALSHADTIRIVLQQILVNASKIVHAKGSKLFLISTIDKSLNLYASNGLCKEYGEIFAQEVIVSKTTKVFIGNEINEKLKKTPDEVNELVSELPEEFDIHQSNPHIRPGRITTLIDRSSKINQSDGYGTTSEIVVCCIPLMSSDSSPIGVMEIQCISKILAEDIKLLECFAVFASASIERTQLITLAKLGQSELEMSQLMLPDEKPNFGPVPEKLLVKDPTMWKISFNAQDYDGKHISVVFSIFERFDFLSSFKISNEKLFRFLYEVRDTYKHVPYHNWRHAIDVTQFLTFQLLQSGYDKKFSKLELLSLIISSICHDANHDGFTNVYNVKAETPLGILFKNQSVMETHHCQVTIKIISKEECNIFSALAPNDYKKIWSSIISLILATDMARHFELVKSFTSLLDNGEFSMDNPDVRLQLMQLMLKCGDISNVARPFEIADKWCDVLCEEFFRQGDLEQASGMEYSSPLNDRASLNKPKSQIGFYSFVCLPLFQVVARAVPSLKVSVDQVESNLQKWILAESIKK